MHRLLVLSLLHLSLVATPTLAHDMWLDPSSLAPPRDELLHIGLRVGHPGQGVEVVPRDSTRIVRFAAIQGGLEVPILGQDTRHPAGFLRTQQDGLLTLLYRSNTARSELPADRFEAYLVEEGLTAIRALRRDSRQTGQPGREIYSRCLKALVTVGGASGEADRWQGMTLEWVAETLPAHFEPSARLPFRLLYEGEPLPGALVTAFRLDGEAPEVTAVTDPKGRVELELSAAGVWLVTATHMVPLPAGGEADWESFWAALTFRLPPKP